MMTKLQLNRGRINSTVSEEEAMKITPFQPTNPQSEAGFARLGGFGESVSPFKGAALNISNINAFGGAMQSQVSVDRTSNNRGAGDTIS